MNKEKQEKPKSNSEKLKIKGTLDDVLKVSIPQPKEDKKDS